MFKSIILVLAVSLVTSTFAQFGFNAVDAPLIAELKKLEDEKNVGFVSTSKAFTFLKTKNGVEAEERIDETVINLKDNSVIGRSIFYDDQSDLSKPRPLTASGVKLSVVSSSNADYEVDGLFYTDAKVCNIAIYPNSKGMQARYAISKDYHDVKYLTSCYFHEIYAALESRLEFQIPSWLDVELKEMNFEGWNIEHSAEVVGDVTKHVYTAKNLKSFKNENNSMNRASEYPHILVLAKSYLNTENQSQNLFASTDDLYAWYNSLVSEVDNNLAVIEPKVSELTKDQTTDLGKIASIFYWVQDNIRYIAFEDGIMGFKPAAANEVFEKKYGDCKGMANLTKEMLSIAGFDARLTWIGTRGIPYDYSIPSLAVDNHMICTVFHEGKSYFLDATEAFIEIDEYAHRIQGRPVLIQDGDNFILDNVPEFGSEKNKVIKRVRLALADEDFVGSYNVVYTGEEKTDIIRDYAYLRSDKTDQALNEFISGINRNFLISNLETKGLDTREGDLEFNFDFNWRHQVTRLDNEIYINIDPVQEFANSKIDNDRQNSFTFSNRFLLDDQFEFQIPSGYKVTYRPDDKSFDHPDFSFSVSSEISGDKLIQKKTINVKAGQIKSADFAAWNEMILQLNSYYKEQFVLKSSK